MDAKAHNDPLLEPFYLPGVSGRLFCTFYPPAAGERTRALLVLPAFAEEMNKSRRMVSLMARALQERGWGVLVPDLFGTGDSEGDFADASIESWRDDVRTSMNWLAQRSYGPIDILALRTGALLLADWPHTGAAQFGRLVLWQPVVSGKQFAGQFLRLRLAGDLIAGHAGSGDGEKLREELARTGSLEVAGYRVSANLVGSLERCNLADVPAAAFHSIEYFEVGTAALTAVSPAAQRVADVWRRLGCEVTSVTVPGEPFWSTVEIATAPDLIAASVAVLREGGHG